MHNATYWRRYFNSSFVPHLERTLQALENRILPAFDGIDTEADEIREATYEAFMTRPGDPEADPFSVSEMAAEAAFEAGYDHFSGMDAVRQSLLNSFAVILYHTWEQQLLAFHRREVLHPADEHDNQLLKLSELQRRLRDNGVDIVQLPTWPTISELRLVANTVKHADGGSADHLKTCRSDLFEPHHANRERIELPFRYTRRVYKPLSGEDLYLTLADLREYCRATIAFWGELADALDRPHDTDGV